MRYAVLCFPCMTTAEDKTEKNTTLGGWRLPLHPSWTCQHSDRPSYEREREREDRKRYLEQMRKFDKICSILAFRLQQNSHVAIIEAPASAAACPCTREQTRVTKHLIPSRSSLSVARIPAQVAGVLINTRSRGMPAWHDIIVCKKNRFHGKHMRIREAFGVLDRSSTVYLWLPYAHRRCKQRRQGRYTSDEVLVASSTRRC